MPCYQRQVKHGIRWFYKFKHNKAVYFSKCIYLTIKEARRAESIKYEEVTAKERNPAYKPVLSLENAINDRLDFVLAKKSKDYYKDNKRYYKLLLQEIGNISIDQVKRSEIENILLAVSQKQKKAGGDNYVVNLMLAIFKALFNHSIDRNDLNFKNPCNGIKPFSVNKKLKYIPNDKDIEEVRNLCDEGQNALIDFVMETGCRINEALRISADDVYPEFIVLYTRKSMNSNLVPRKVPRPKCLTSNLEGRIFSRWSDTPKFLEHKVAELEQRNWSWHNLRHRYASLLSKKGIPLYEIMILLGHSNLKTTQNYLQLIP